MFKYTCICSQCHIEFNPFTLSTAVKSNLWPGSLKRLSYFIKEEVFELWDSLRKRMPGTSEKSFLDMLNDISSLHGRVSVLYHFLIFYYHRLKY